jgi:hypothetical protein
LGTFTCGSIGTFSRSIDRTGRCLIDVIAAEDVIIGWVDVGYVGLLVDSLGFPTEWDEGYDFVLVSDERSCTGVGEEDVIVGVVIVEPQIDTNACLGHMVDVEVHL